MWSRFHKVLTRFAHSVWHRCEAEKSPSLLTSSIWLETLRHVFPNGCASSFNNIISYCIFFTLHISDSTRVTHPASGPETLSWCGGQPRFHSRSSSRTESPPRRWRWLKVCAGELDQTGFSPAWERRAETEWICLRDSHIRPLVFYY